MAEVLANVARKNVPKWKSYFMGFACLASDRKGHADNIPRVSLQAPSVTVYFNIIGSGML